MVVKKLVVKVSDTQTELFEGCTVEVEDQRGVQILNIFDSKKNIIASFYRWNYWRYMDEK